MSFLPYLVLGGAVAYYTIYSKRHYRTRQRQVAKGTHHSYMDCRYPVMSLSEALRTTDVKAKDAKLIKTERGPAGSVKYTYYLPSTQTITHSYAPLDTHTAK